MANLSFIERINLFIETVKNNEISKFVIPGIVLISIILIFLSFGKHKVLKVLTSIIYLGIIGFGIYYFSNPLLSFLDYFIEIIVNNILFPNLAVFTFIIITINIALFISIISNRISKLAKCVNIIFFMLMQILLF